MTAVMAGGSICRTVLCKQVSTCIACSAGGSAALVMQGVVFLMCMIVRPSLAMICAVMVARRDRVTCLCVSSDCRWLLSSAMDGSIRVWDIPAAKCLQVGPSVCYMDALRHGQQTISSRQLCLPAKRLR